VREHTDSPVQQQGGRQEPAGENKDGNLPQEEESPVLRDFRQEQLQLREALSLPCKEALRVGNRCGSVALLLCFISVIDAALLHCCFALSV
jgi:hypothetical protein